MEPMPARTSCCARRHSLEPPCDTSLTQATLAGLATHPEPRPAALIMGRVLEPELERR